MRKKIVVGNWKMNGTLASIDELVNGLLERQAAHPVQTEVVVLPALVHMQTVATRLQDCAWYLGAQDASEHSSGAFTGQVSASMLSELGCTYCLAGHSERRLYNFESDVVVAKKFVQMQQAGLTPILCIGESLQQRRAGQTEMILQQQLQAVLELSGISAFSAAVLAYEPVWAIGTGEAATPQQAQQVHAFCRQLLAEHDQGIADNLTILYGGSVKPDNTAALLQQADIDGALVGGASLRADSFWQICQQCPL